MRGSGRRSFAQKEYNKVRKKAVFFQKTAFVFVLLWTPDENRESILFYSVSIAVNVPSDWKASRLIGSRKSPKSELPLPDMAA